MFLKTKFFLGALALIGASGIMASDCGSNAVKTIIGQSGDTNTYRSSTSHISYSRDSGWGGSYEASGTGRASAENRTYLQRSVDSSTGSYDANHRSGGGRVGRKENL